MIDRSEKRSGTGVDNGAAEHDERSEMNADHYAQRVESLREVQTEVASLRRTKVGGERVGGDLKRGEPAGQDEQRTEDRPEGGKVGAPHDEQAA